MDVRLFTITMSVPTPRFSLRTLGVFVSLVCVYLGSWQMTTQFGLGRVTSYLKHQAIDVESSWSPVPFLVVTHVSVPSEFISLPTDYPQTRSYRDHYYVWCGGPVFQLPEPLSDLCDQCCGLWDMLRHPFQSNPRSVRVHGGMI
jgi:hypothetical protein